MRDMIVESTSPTRPRRSSGKVTVQMPVLASGAICGGPASSSSRIVLMSSMRSRFQNRASHARSRCRSMTNGLSMGAPHTPLRFQRVALMLTFSPGRST